MGKYGRECPKKWKIWWKRTKEDWMSEDILQAIEPRRSLKTSEKPYKSIEKEIRCKIQETRSRKMFRN